MDYSSDLIFPREKTGRDATVRNMYDHGKVIEQVVDETQVSVICQIPDKDNFITKPLPVKQFGSRGTGAFWCPKVGDDVSITFYPNGETGDGCVDGSFYNTGNPPPVTNPNKRHITTNDQTIIEYDEDTHTLKVEITEQGGPVNIETKGNVLIKSETMMFEAGTIRIRGNIIMEGIFDLDGIILNTHVHSGVQPGAGETGPPVGP